MFINLCREKKHQYRRKWTGLLISKPAQTKIDAEYWKLFKTLTIIISVRFTKQKTGKEKESLQLCLSAKTKIVYYIQVRDVSLLCMII